MKRRIFLISAIVVLVFACSHAVFAASYNPKTKFRTIDTEHFSIHYPEKMEPFIQNVANTAEEVHDILSPKYKWVPWGRTQMLIEDSSDVVMDMASVIPYNWIYLRMTTPDVDSSLAYFDDWLRLLIFHEYTHILHLDKDEGFWRGVKLIFGKLTSPNGVSPGWIKEGQAIFEETINTKGGRGRASYPEMIIRTAILQDKFPTIDLADGDQWNWPAGSARYIYGIKFLQYLAETYGEDKLYEFIEMVSRSPLLFETNRQARRAYSKEYFVTKKIHNRYVREKNPDKPRSKTFYDFWKDWHEHLKKKYAVVEEKVEEGGVTPFDVVATSKRIVSGPAISPDGAKMVYSEYDPFGPPEVKISDADGKNARRLLKNTFSSQISFSKDGKKIVYSKAGAYKRYNYFFDLYEYDFDKKKEKRLTVGKRANDPDISPDGSGIVCVTQDMGTKRLELYSYEEKKLTPINIDVPALTQFSNPRFSPDGKKIAVSVSVPGSFWDIYIFDRKGKKIVQVTRGTSLDRDPYWSADGRGLYFSSDRTGISNIYRYNLGTRKTERVTNVLTGAFKPLVAGKGGPLVVQYYNGNGFDLRSVPASRIRPTSKGVKEGKSVREFLEREEPDYPLVGFRPEEGAQPSALPRADTPASRLLKYPTRKYSALGHALLLPRFIMPNGALLDDAFLISIMTGAADPLRWHNWVGGVTYRTDDKHVGYFFHYFFNRFRPVFNMGVLDYSVDFGNFTFAYATPKTIHLYEKRLRGYAGISYPIGKHGLSLSYYYEDRNPTHVSLTPAEKAVFNFGAFAGFNFRYGYNDSKQYQASISRTGGRHVKLSFQTSNSIFGSADNNEQYVFAGDWREYIGLWGRTVLAFRAMGGMTWGDELRQGTFTVGGSLGEGVLAGLGSLYYLPLRGLPQASISSTRAMLMSTELRFPLLSVQRGLGTTPFFLNDVHFALFADYGNGWNANGTPGKYFFGDFMLGVGAELRGDFVVGHGLPIKGRLGYGVVVVNRDRIGGLTDPILKHSADKGVIIIQLGTSF